MATQSTYRMVSISLGFALALVGAFSVAAYAQDRGSRIDNLNVRTQNDFLKKEADEQKKKKAPTPATAEKAKKKANPDN